MTFLGSSCKFFECKRQREWERHWESLDWEESDPSLLQYQSLLSCLLALALNSNIELEIQPSFFIPIWTQANVERVMSLKSNLSWFWLGQPFVEQPSRLAEAKNKYCILKSLGIFLEKKWEGGRFDTNGFSKSILRTTHAYKTRLLYWSPWMFTAIDERSCTSDAIFAHCHTILESTKNDGNPLSATAHFNEV